VREENVFRNARKRKRQKAGRERLQRQYRLSLARPVPEMRYQIIEIYSEYPFIKMRLPLIGRTALAFIQQSCEIATAINAISSVDDRRKNGAGRLLAALVVLH